MRHIICNDKQSDSVNLIKQVNRLNSFEFVSNTVKFITRFTNKYDYTIEYPYQKIENPIEFCNSIMCVLDYLENTNLSFDDINIKTPDRQYFTNKKKEVEEMVLIEPFYEKNTHIRLRNKKGFL